MSGKSYDNTLKLSGTTFRHVKFIEQFDLDDPNRVGGRWLMMSDVCKHCVQAGCLEVCPTGAIMRTEFDTVYIQQDVCNGCRYCVAGCPFGVIEMNERGVAGKCTMCYDRLQAGLDARLRAGVPDREHPVRADRPAAAARGRARWPRCSRWAAPRRGCTVETRRSWAD